MGAQTLSPRTELIYELLHSSHVHRILSRNVNSVLRVSSEFVTTYFYNGNLPPFIASLLYLKKKKKQKGFGKLSHHFFTLH